MKYIAVDQHNSIVPLVTDHPRKELLERLSYRHAGRMYQDRKDGTMMHIGYVIGPYWLRVYGVEGRTFERPV